MYPHFFQPLLPGFQNHLKIPVKFFSDHIKGKHDGSTVKLRSDASEKTWSMRMMGQRLTEGWKEFVEAHDLRVGDIVVFRHERDMKFHVTALGPSCCEIQYSQSPNYQEEEDEETDENEKEEGKKKILSEEDHIDDKTKVNRFVMLTPTPYGLKIGKQHLPVSFTRENGIIKPGNIIMVDRTGDEWRMKLKVYPRNASLYIWSGKGWKDFCVKNGVNAYEWLPLELIRGGTSPMLKFCSKKDQIPVARMHKRARVGRWRHETGPKLQKREKTFAEGESSSCTKSRANQGNLQRTQPSSVSDQVAKVKQRVVDTLTSIRRFREELETMEHKLEDSLHEINNLGKRGEDNENETTSSSDNHV